MEKTWHSLSSEEAIEKLNSSPHGLSAEKARERLLEYGPNSLPEEKRGSAIGLFLSQFNSPLIFILFGASVIMYGMGETVDAFLILAILFFNAVVGMVQEGRAQNTLRALKKFVDTKATVLRGGKEFIISDRDVVPGDILILQAGEKIPADARMIASQSLKTDEASLTGESEPVDKTTDVVNGSAVAAEQRNMVFKGTNIVAGSGRAIVALTGSSTFIGQIAKELSTIDTEIPLRANIRYLSRAIIAAVGVICTVLFAIGISSGLPVRVMFATVVSLSVSIIPEGLPIVMTLVLATGVWRMSKRNALVKKLQAVEALGQARVIAVDKTGTITKNELVIREVWTGGKTFSIGGIGYEPAGDIELDGSVVDSANHPELLFVGKTAALCANAELSYLEEEKRWGVTGDPTEAAMLVFAEKVGFHKNDLLSESPLISEMPFDYRLKYHATINTVDDEKMLTVIGAPEIILDLSREIDKNGKSQPLSKEERAELEEVFVRMSERGLRVIACAVRRRSGDVIDPEKVVDLTFVGFVGMKDVLRPEVEEAMVRARDAGIKVVMITGDHKITARAIAKEAGIYRNGDEMLTGAEIDSMTDTALAEKLSRTTVFARVTPDHKLRIVGAFKKRGEIVAMTGDGINDAPSLMAADLGVAMGRIGTEVAKEAADIVLLDDNFGSIISAVEEGRSIYKTIKKVILYLFSTSLGEVLVISGALVLGIRLPLLAAQIIWLNFVTDGFLDVSLAMEPKEKGLLSGTFEHPKKYLVDVLMLERMFFMAIPMMAGTLYLFSKYITVDSAKALTISLTVLAVFQWFNAWNCRSETKSVLQTNPFSNLYLVGATAVVIFLQILAVYTPFLQKILHTVPLSLADWLVIVPVAASVIVVEEIRKYSRRRLIP